MAESGELSQEVLIVRGLAGANVQTPSWCERFVLAPKPRANRAAANAEHQRNLVRPIADLRTGFSSLTASEDGIRVSNAFSSFGLKWSEIERFEIGR